jgi:hypothetical protein
MLRCRRCSPDTTLQLSSYLHHEHKFTEVQTCARAARHPCRQHDVPPLAPPPLQGYIRGVILSGKREEDLRVHARLNIMKLLSVLMLLAGHRGAFHGRAGQEWAVRGWSLEVPRRPKDAGMPDACEHEAYVNSS